jgi:hypothetical protein
VAVAAVIQAHPSRKELAESLRDSLAPLPTEISYHSSDPPSPWAGYLQALESGLQTLHSHLCVIQEDARICQNFAAVIAKIAQARPDDVIQLFTGSLKGKTTKDFLQAQIKHKSYSPVWFREIHNVVAILWPREAVESFLAWSPTAKVPGPQPPRSDDSVFGYWARTTHRQIWATVPCLVEHPPRGTDTSLIGNEFKGGRQAIAFIGDADPLEIDWSP